MTDLEWLARYERRERTALRVVWGLMFGAIVFGWVASLKGPPRVPRIEHRVAGDMGGK